MPRTARTRRLSLAAASIALAAITGGALAGPLTPQRVAPGATWVAHIDVEAFVGSPMGRAFLDGQNPNDLGQGVSDLRDQFGLDVTRDIKGITVSGQSSNDDDALIVISTTAAIDQPLARIGELVPNYAAITEGTRTIHTWNDGGETTYAYVRHGDDPVERVVIFSENLDHLRQGMLRLEGVGAADPVPALAGPGPAAGVYVYFSASDLPSVLDDEGAAAILQSAQSLTFEAGDNAGTFFARAALATQNPEEAVSMQQIAQGMYAMARMAVAGEPEAQKHVHLMNGFTTTVSGSVVRFSYEHDSAALVNFLRSEVMSGNLDADLGGLTGHGPRGSGAAKVKGDEPAQAQPQNQQPATAE